MLTTREPDTLVFRHQEPAPPPCDWLSISFDVSDKIKILDAPHPDMAAAIVAAMKGFDLRSHEVESRPNSRLKLKFFGRPWEPSGTGTVRLRLLLLSLLDVLERFGFSLYASIDQCNDVDNSGEADVLIVVKQKDWIAGLPVFHR